MRDGEWSSKSDNASGAPKRGMASIEQVLKRWLKDNKVAARTESSEVAGEQAIYGEWKEIVGPEIAARTRIVDVRRGEIIVEVDSAALLNELSTYYSREILDSIREREPFRGIHKIRFKAGAF